MRKKWDRKGNIWKESNLDPFVWKSDHSRRNCDTAMRRGRCSAWAKNTVAFGRNNKRRKAGDAWKQSQLERINARLVSLSTVCMIQVKVFRQTQREGGENGSRWYISCVLWSSEKLVCGLPGSSALFAVQWSAVVSLNRVRDVSFRLVATFLLHTHLSGTSLRSVMHHRGVPAGMLPLLSANVSQHLGCRPLMGERRQRKPKSKKNKKKEYRKGKRLVQWGKKRAEFSCSQPVLLMYTPKQPEAHSSQSRWLIWQFIWQPLRTLKTALRLCFRPVLCCTPLPSPPHPYFSLASLPSHTPRHIWHHRIKPSIPASQFHDGASSFGNNFTPRNWHEFS